jgi:hypothetical protein
MYLMLGDNLERDGRMVPGVKREVIQAKNVDNLTLLNI